MANNVKGVGWRSSKVFRPKLLLDDLYGCGYWALADGARRDLLNEGSNISGREPNYEALKFAGDAISRSIASNFLGRLLDHNSCEQVSGRPGTNKIELSVNTSSHD